MYLKKLEIFGFKSFGHRVNLEFPKGITCIIGPNGVGKSNLVEAIRWTIGEQSLKNLRSKKSEDIIFSSGKNRLNFAETYLYLENIEEKEGPKELIIGRKVWRNGENEYLINKKRVKLQDFLVTIAKANFGPKSYSVIGQGMVDSILYLSPSERKEFFTEATGIKKYQLRKKEAILKLKKTQENLNQVEVALQEIEPRMKFLTRQIKKLAKRKDLEKNLIELQKKYYGSKKFRLEKEEEELNKEITKIKTEIDKKSAELKSLQERFKKNYEIDTNNLFSKLQNDYYCLLEERRKILDELAKGKTESKIFKKPYHKLEEIEEIIKKVVTDQENLINRLNKVEKIEELKIISKDLKETIEKLKKCLKIFQEEEGVSSQQTEILNKKLGTIDQKIKDLETNLKNVLKEEEIKRKEIINEQEKIQKKQEEISRINFLLKEKEIELAKLETKKEDLEEEIKRDILDPKLIENLEKRLLTLSEEEELFLKIKKIKGHLEMIEAIDPNISQEYQECSQRYNFLSSQFNDLKEAIASLKKIKEELNEKIKNEFITNFNKINQEFEKYFKILFKGGSAKLFLEEKEEEEGSLESEEDDKWLIEIKAKPPGKKIKTLDTLSGGEKALTSLALIFAIIKIKSPPFVVLDEVDAALDEINSLRFREIVKDLAKKIQFIIITHNNVVVEMADVLYGLTMKSDGISYPLSLKLE
ncbi:MAG: AAA family ATPase [Patescibacteria group bacterium]